MGIALEKVRADNMARLELVSDAPPGLGAVPWAAGATHASLRASLSRYLAPPTPPPDGDGPPHDHGSVGHTSRAADAPGHASRVAGQYERIGMGPPGGDPPDDGDDWGHGEGHDEEDDDRGDEPLDPPHRKEERKPGKAPKPAPPPPDPDDGGD